MESSLITLCSQKPQQDTPLSPCNRSTGRANAGQEGIAIDLARWEDLPSHWQERLRRQALALT